MNIPDEEVVSRYGAAYRFNRHKVRCVQITSQESIYRAESLSCTRLSLYMERTLGKVSQYSFVRECHAIPCVLPLVQYIR